MKVFITGASGYVGGVVTEHLLAAGHEVTALARSDQAAERVQRLGATAVRGDLGDLEVLRDAAGAADAVVHAAVDFTEPAMRGVEEPALTAMLGALDGDRGFVYASTAMVYPDTAAGAPDEDGALDPESPQLFKAEGERQVLAADGVTATVLRASLVYGRAGSALLMTMIGAAKQAGAAPYVDAGTNQWSTIHVEDLARLYVAAVEKRIGGVFNASSRGQVGVRELAEGIARLVGAGTQPLTQEQAAEAFGPFLPILAREITLDPTRAEENLDWKPQEAGLIEEIDAGSYRALAG